MRFRDRRGLLWLHSCGHFQFSLHEIQNIMVIADEMTLLRTFQFSLHEILERGAIQRLAERRAFNSLFMRFEARLYEAREEPLPFNSLFMRFIPLIATSLRCTSSHFQFSLHEIPTARVRSVTAIDRRAFNSLFMRFMKAYIGASSASPFTLRLSCLP